MPSPGFSFKSEKKGDGEKQQQQQRRDPYEVLGVARNSTDQEIKSAYRRMALKYHPDKNLNDPVASDMFKEVTFSYNILSDPNKRHQYDTSGFEIDELLKERNAIHASYTTVPPLKRSSSSSRIRTSFRASQSNEDGQTRERKRDRTWKKRWFNIHLKMDKRKPC